LEQLVYQFWSNGHLFLLGSSSSSVFHFDHFHKLFYTLPGVGKTLSARYYARWDAIEKFFPFHRDKNKDTHLLVSKEFDISRTIYFIAAVTKGGGYVKREIQKAHSFTNINSLEVNGIDYNDTCTYRSGHVQLIIVDEADRLNNQGLEQIRDIYDRSSLGVILIGMPGIEKRLSRYPQLYSRVGFVHNFQPMSSLEMEHLLITKWSELGLTFDPNEFADKEAVAEIVRVTRGNFRLLYRLFDQISRVMKINNLNALTKEVVEVARENLIIGSV
jgi:DNA transposition AAA+ family ATPase